MAPRLHVVAIRRVALPRQFLLHRPRSHPCRGIVDGHDVLERVVVHTRPALDEVQVLTRALELGLAAEVRHVHDQRVPFPTTARVAPPLPHVWRQVRIGRHRYDALPALSLPRVVEDRDSVWRLADLSEATEVWQGACHASLAKRSILGAVSPIDRTPALGARPDVELRVLVSPPSRPARPYSHSDRRGT